VLAGRHPAPGEFAAEGAEYLGRNQRFFATPAQFLMVEALTQGIAFEGVDAGLLVATATRNRDHFTNAFSGAGRR